MKHRFNNVIYISNDALSREDTVLLYQEFEAAGMLDGYSELRLRPGKFSVGMRYFSEAVRTFDLARAIAHPLVSHVSLNVEHCCTVCEKVFDGVAGFTPGEGRPTEVSAGAKGDADGVVQHPGLQLQGVAVVDTFAIAADGGKSRVLVESARDRTFGNASRHQAHRLVITPDAQASDWLLTLDEVHRDGFAYGAEIGLSALVHLLANITTDERDAILARKATATGAEVPYLRGLRLPTAR